ncbi:MAG: IPT/TIG domain-containing protein [Pseudomonadota bacterium]
MEAEYAQARPKKNQSIKTSALIMITVFSLTSCGGGGGSGGTAGNFSLSPGTLNFVAETPASVTVGSRQITAGLSESFSGTIFLQTSITGNVVTGFNNFAIDPGGNSASTLLNIATPTELGPGIHTSNIAVKACLNSPTCSSGEISGSPARSTAIFEVKSSVKADTLMPRTGIANQEGSVILRGSGFQTDGITAVTFGSTAAKSFSIVSDSEIHAVYEVAPAGTYDVQLTNLSGDVPFTPDLKLIDPDTYASTTLAYPVVAEKVLQMIFDSERAALIIALETSDRSQSKILRYQFANGSFTSLSTFDLPFLRDLTLTPDSSEIIAISDSSIVHLNAATLAQTNSMLVNPTGDYFLKELALSNDGNIYIVSEEVSSFPFVEHYLYILSTGTLLPAFQGCNIRLKAAASSDGSSIIVINDGLRGADDFCKYDSSAGSFARMGAFDTKVCRDCPDTLSHSGDRYAYAFDISGTGIIVYEDTGSTVFNELGRISGYYSGLTFNQNGDILYAYDRTNSLLRAFDLNIPLAGNTFQEIGSGTTLAGSTGDVVNLQILTDDGTLFVAGESLIAIQSLP